MAEKHENKIKPKDLRAMEYREKIKEKPGWTCTMNRYDVIFDVLSRLNDPFQYFKQRNDTVK